MKNFKLSLNKETLRSLNPVEAVAVQAGRWVEVEPQTITVDCDTRNISCYCTRLSGCVC